MKDQDLILLGELCSHYSVEISFFEEVEQHGLLQVLTIADQRYVAMDQLSHVERIIRLHQDLQVNLEGIDVIFNLLERIDSLEQRLKERDSRLGVYERP